MNDSIIVSKNEILRKTYTDYGKYFKLAHKFLQLEEYEVLDTDFKTMLSLLIVSAIVNPKEKSTLKCNMFLLFTKENSLSDDEVLVLADLLHDTIYSLALKVVKHNPKLYRDELVPNIKFPRELLLNTDISLLAPVSFSTISRFKQGLLSLINDKYPYLYVEVCNSFSNNLGSVDYMINVLLATLYKYDTYILNSEDYVKTEGDKELDTLVLNVF